MQAQPDDKTVGDLLQLKTANMLYPNLEYERGAVWTSPQKKRLVDSLLRGYPIPPTSRRTTRVGTGRMNTRT